MRNNIALLLTKLLLCCSILVIGCMGPSKPKKNLTVKGDCDRRKAEIQDEYDRGMAESQAEYDRFMTGINPLYPAYKVLNLHINADFLDVKKAYKALSLKWHPDKNQNNPEAEERFKEISLAYSLIEEHNSYTHP